MKRFEIRLEPDLFAQIERLAQTERRTINQQMLVLLVTGLWASKLDVSETGVQIVDGINNDRKGKRNA